MSNEDFRTSDGFWEFLTRTEMSASRVLGQDLLPLKEAFRETLGAGIHVAMVPSERHGAPDMLLAALFLKRSLNDLRAVLILLNLGYTSQAGSVAAAAFENALAVACLAGSPKNAEAYKNSKSNGVPWSVQQMAKMVTGESQETQHPVAKCGEDAQNELAWMNVYGHYKWLCQIKHPTLRSALHDSKTTATSEEEYVVMALPNTTKEDLPAKIIIAVIACNRVFGGIRSFAGALGYQKSPPDDPQFLEKMIKADKALDRALSMMKRPLPFSVADTRLGRKWYGTKRSPSET